MYLPKICKICPQYLTHHSVKLLTILWPLGHISLICFHLLILVMSSGA